MKDLIRCCPAHALRLYRYQSDERSYQLDSDTTELELETHRHLVFGNIRRLIAIDIRARLEVATVVVEVLPVRMIAGMGEERFSVDCLFTSTSN